MSEQSIEIACGIGHIVKTFPSASRCLYRGFEIVGCYIVSARYMKSGFVLTFEMEQYIGLVVLKHLCHQLYIHVLYIYFLGCA